MYFNLRKKFESKKKKKNLILYFFHVFRKQKIKIKSTVLFYHIRAGPLCLLIYAEKLFLLCFFHENLLEAYLNLQSKPHIENIEDFKKVIKRIIN